LFSKSRPREFVEAVLQTTKITPERFRQIYGDQAFESDYDFMQEMLQMTPKKIIPWMPLRQAGPESSLLLIKVMSTPMADSGIFSISAPGFRGFQFGNPATRPSRMERLSRG
jgi:hypothetical protein